MSPKSLRAVSLLAVALGAAATPALQERASSKCVTLVSGYLTTSVVNDHWEPFAFNSDNEVAWSGGSGTPIWAEFQTCTPNYAGASNTEPTYYGRVYIPSSSSCLAVQNASDNSAGPYYVHQTGCLSSASGEEATAASIPYNFAYRTFSQDTSREILFWTGATKADGSATQGGSACTGGYFGYKHDASGVPVTSTNDKIEAYCDDDTSVASVFAELRQAPSA